MGKWQAMIVFMFPIPSTHKRKIWCYERKSVRSYVIFHKANHHKNNMQICGDAKYYTSIVRLLRKINVENINFPSHGYNTRYHAFEVNPWMVYLHHDNMEAP